MSNKPLTARTMAVVSAFRQSLETNVSPGTSINRHPNAFFLNVNGEVDLLAAAELAIARIDEHDAVALASLLKEEAALSAAAPSAKG